MDTNALRKPGSHLGSGTDHDGKIGHGAFFRALRFLGLSVCNADAELLFHAVDKDGNGFLTEAQFVANHLRNHAG